MSSSSYVVGIADSISPTEGKSMPVFVSLVAAYESCGDKDRVDPIIHVCSRKTRRSMFVLFIADVHSLSFWSVVACSDNLLPT